MTTPIQCVAFVSPLRELEVHFACHLEHSMCLRLTPRDRCNDPAYHFMYFYSDPLFIFSFVLYYGYVTLWGFLVYVRVSFRVKWDT